MLVFAAACSSGPARGPQGPPPVYEPRPRVEWAGSTNAADGASEPDALDALLNDPAPASSTGQAQAPVDQSATSSSPTIPASSSTGAPPTTSLP